MIAPGMKMKHTPWGKSMYFSINAACSPNKGETLSQVRQIVINLRDHTLAWLASFGIRITSCMDLSEGDLIKINFTCCTTRNLSKMQLALLQKAVNHHFSHTDLEIIVPRL